MSNQSTRGTVNNPGTNCKDILDNGGSIGDGNYWIDLNSGFGAFEVYCDMTSDGGGWTLVMRGYGGDVPSGWESDDDLNISYNKSSTMTGTFKYSNTKINTISDNMFYMLKSDGTYNITRYAGGKVYDHFNNTENRALASTSISRTCQNVGLSVGCVDYSYLFNTDSCCYGGHSGISDMRRTTESEYKRYFILRFYNTWNLGNYVNNSYCNGTSIGCNFSFWTR